MSEAIYTQESVYNCIPKEEKPPPKPPRYVSKFRVGVVEEIRSVKVPMKTMGPAKVELPSPEKYLKKHSKEPKQPEKTEYPKDIHQHSSPPKNKSPVPAVTDIPTMGIHTKRDFTKTTVALPRKPKPISVDTRRGDKQVLENSGLVPKYIRKKDFGEIPEYLQHRNEEERRAQEEYDNYVRERREEGAMKRVSEEERETVLEGLKENWDELLREYLGMSLITDTMSKKAHKKRLEEAMKQLEKDIQLLERFKTIYVTKH